MKAASPSRAAGFSLVEIVLAIGVVAFAFLGIFSLLPAGMEVFRTSMNTSVSTQIAQRVLNEAQQTKFPELIGGVPPQEKYHELIPIRYFDNEGNELPTARAKESVFHVRAIVQSSPKYPDAGGNNTVKMDDLASVLVQIAHNPGQRTMPTDGPTLRWKTTANVPMKTYSVVVPRND